MKSNPSLLWSPARATSPLGRRERKKHALRRALMDTAVALIRERGYDDTTVEAIVRRVDVSQPTFYNYFPSKDALLGELAFELSAEWGERLAVAFPPGASAFDKLSQLNRAMAEWITGDRTLWTALVRAGALDRVRHPRLRERQEASLRPVQQLLAEGQGRGELDPSIPAHRLCDLLESIQRDSIEAWTADYPAAFDLGARFDENLAFFMRAAGVKGALA